MGLLEMIVQWCGVHGLFIIVLIAAEQVYCSLTVFWFCTVIFCWLSSFFCHFS